MILILREKTSTQQDYESAIYGATAKERPFVHIFVIQESMKLDSLQSVSSSSFSALQVVLFTYDAQYLTHISTHGAADD